MPGPDIEDLLDWRDVLGRFRTGVERHRKRPKEQEIDKENQRRIRRNVQAQGMQFMSGFQLARGDVEDLILLGMDADGNRPVLADPETDGCFRYELVNLDFCGGLGYKDKQGHSKRVKAIQKLIERQRAVDFLLLLTLNVRDNMGTELVEYLTSNAKRHRKITPLSKALAWYASRQSGEQCYVLKAGVPIFIQQTAEIFCLRVFSYPPIVYEGTNKSQLVHFVFQFASVPGTDMPVTSEQWLEELIALPMVQVKDQKMMLAPVQHPGFDFSICNSCFDFLSLDTKTSLLETVSKVVA